MQLPTKTGRFFSISDILGSLSSMKLPMVRSSIPKWRTPTAAATAGFLSQRGVDTLICGGIGGGAQTALAEAGIKLYGGVSGDADAAVNALLSGNLSYDPHARCDHHDNEHRKGGDSCGEHGCGHQSGH